MHDYFQYVLAKRATDDLGLTYTEKRLMVQEIEQLRAGQTAFINEQKRLNQLLHEVWEALEPIPNTTYADIVAHAKAVVAELLEFRADAATPLSDNDRVGEILANVSGKLYDKKAREDMVWLTTEISRLRQLIKWVNQRLTKNMWVAETDRDNTRAIVDGVVHHSTSRAKELAKIHDILAEALGYEKAPTLEEDPACPCPGDYITGEHTAETLAVEAAQILKSRQDHINSLSQSVDRAFEHIRELERGLAGRPMSNPVDFNALQALQALREYANCICPYNTLDRKILLHLYCPTHGIEAEESQTKAINDLNTIRRIILGHPDGDRR